MGQDCGRIFEDLLHNSLKGLGYNQFRGKQKEAITAAMRGTDCLVLMPTGGGKSLCYALPAVMTGKLAIVVSPLIALMQDQVRNFNNRGIKADYYCSTRTAKERAAIEQGLQGSTDLRLLFVTPETFSSEQLVEHLRSVYARGQLALVAIDEAHCISSWGHDFRPAYRRLSSIRRELPRVPIMALTATATRQVQDDIASSVLRNPLRLCSSFNRPNISYHVRYQLNDSPSAVSQIADLIEEMKDSTGGTPCSIIYTLKRETADEVAGRLKAKGVHAAAYHAGLKDADRAQVLERWSSGQIPVVAATIAFGMGIDRACVRLVAHLNLPKTLEGFYQESGRAGRDGLPSRSVLFYDVDDRERMDYILGKEQGRKRKKGIRNASSSTDVDRGQQAFYKVVSYCVGEQCRRAMLLAHFGERLSVPCSGCDWCLDRKKVSQQLSQLAMEGPKKVREREQKFGGRGFVRYGHDQEGDDDEEDEDEIESVKGVSDDEDAMLAAAEAAARAAKRGRGAGPGPFSQAAMFQELESAEQRYAQNSKESSLGNKGEVILRKLETARTGPAARPVPGTAAVSDSTRQAGVQRILQALRKSAAANGAAESQLASAARAMEQECYASSASRPVYLSKLAHSSTEAKSLNSAADLAAMASRAPAPGVQRAEASGRDYGMASRQAPPATADGRSEEQRGTGERLHQLCEAIEMLMSGGGPLEPGAVEIVLKNLASMQKAHVTASLLRETGIGHRVKALSKGPEKAVATAAKDVVANWKASICKDAS
ncbi:ATP-dependent DNA helicase RecQ [Coccomyxa sp. Obi]|nr:ATP-dependent DNA helicase RecQ [Coccomyxa sp. Obi]